MYNSVVSCDALTTLLTHRPPSPSDGGTIMELPWNLQGEG